MRRNAAAAAVAPAHARERHDAVKRDRVHTEDLLRLEGMVAAAEAERQNATAEAAHLRRERVDLPAPVAAGR